MANEKRLISAKEMERQVKVAFQDNPYLMGQVLRWIRKQPTVDAVEVVHGRWETDKEDMEWGNSLKRKHCTNCGKRPHFDKEKREFVLSDFCPHCGAKMDGERREGE